MKWIKTIYVEVEAASSDIAEVIVEQAFCMDAHPLNDIPAITFVDLDGPLEGAAVEAEYDPKDDRWRAVVKSRSARKDTP